MERLNNIVRSTMIAFWLIALLSCADESDCTLINRAGLNGNFYTRSASNNVKVSLSFLTVKAVRPEGKDTVLINSLQNVENVSLPLQYNVDTTAIVFQYSDVSFDTIVFKHTNTPYFISMECGYEMKQEVTGVSYTTHGIDSLSLTDKNANKDGTENLRIFFVATE